MRVMFTWKSSDWSGPLGALVMLVLFCTSPLAATTVDCAPADAAVAGSYRLRGQPDTSSGLSLFPYGRFLFDIRSGTMNDEVEGCWRRDGEQIELVSSTLLLPIRLVTQTFPNGINAEPFPLSSDDEEFRAFGDSALIFLPPLLPWPPLPVWVEYVDGRIERQQINRGGQARVFRHEMPAIRRIGIATKEEADEPLKWIDNDEPTRRLFYVLVDPLVLEPQYFERMTLRIVAPGRLESEAGLYERDDQ